MNDHFLDVREVCRRLSRYVQENFAHSMYPALVASDRRGGFVKVILKRSSNRGV